MGYSTMSRSKRFEGRVRISGESVAETIETDSLNYGRSLIEIIRSSTKGTLTTAKLNDCRRDLRDR